MNTHACNITPEHSNPWLIEQQALAHLDAAAIETLFALGNGYLGTRGTCGYRDSAMPNSSEGTYLNGVFTREAIHYDEAAYGFARYNDKMLQVPNSKAISISHLGKAFQLQRVVKRQLNLQQASFHESLLLTTTDDLQIQLDITRMVSQRQPELMLNQFKITALNFSGRIQLHGWLENAQDSVQPSDDPRQGRLDGAALTQVAYQRHDNGVIQIQQLANPSSLIAVATAHQFNAGAQVVDISAEPGEPEQTSCSFDVALNGNDNSITMCQYSIYMSSQQLTCDQLSAECNALLQRCVDQGSAWHREQHLALMQQFWQDSDVVISGNEQHQLALRLNLLHLLMSAGRDGKRNIAAKGLTGPGYDGHYFWDSEIYVLPFFIYNQPETAKQLLSYRYQGLAQAKQRARELNHPQGALFPWRTIGGDECSSYFPAGTAQYHINAAIAFAVRHYYRASNDWQFICEQGAELVFETARLWPSLGHFSAEKSGQFCIDTVTGPDEYTALVNNNYYTNAMAQLHLVFAVELAEKMSSHTPELWQELTTRLQLSEPEITKWQEIAERMYLPHDAKRNITPQDDGFLQKKPWDFAGTPKQQYPLLLHFHPLVIYRHQVLKQADVVLANFLLDDAVPAELKRNNLAFYETITTHDSTLSACAHSLVHSELAEQQQAFTYFEETLLTDIEDRHHNTHYGIHTAAMAGSWLCISQGFAGLRVRDGYVYFAPFLPQQWQGLQCKLKLLGCQIALDIKPDEVSYRLLSGNNIKLSHYRQMFTLTSAQPQQTFKLESRR